MSNKFNTQPLMECNKTADLFFDYLDHRRDCQSFSKKWGPGSHGEFTLLDSGTFKFYCTQSLCQEKNDYINMHSTHTKYGHFIKPMTMIVYRKDKNTLQTYLYEQTTGPHTTEVQTHIKLSSGWKTVNIDHTSTLYPTSDRGTLFHGGNMTLYKYETMKTLVASYFNHTWGSQAQKKGGKTRGLQQALMAEIKFQGAQCNSEIKPLIDCYKILASKKWYDKTYKTFKRTIKQAGSFEFDSPNFCLTINLITDEDMNSAQDILETLPNEIDLNNQLVYNEYASPTGDKELDEAFGIDTEPKKIFDIDESKNSKEIQDMIDQAVTEGDYIDDDDDVSDDQGSDYSFGTLSPGIDIYMNSDNKKQETKEFINLNDTSTKAINNNKFILSSKPGDKVQKITQLGDKVRNSVKKTFDLETFKQKFKSGSFEPSNLESLKQKYKSESLQALQKEAQEQSEAEVLAQIKAESEAEALQEFREMQMKQNQEQNQYQEQIRLQKIQEQEQFRMELRERDRQEAVERINDDYKKYIIDVGGEEWALPFEEYLTYRTKEAIYKTAYGT